VSENEFLTMAGKDGPDTVEDLTAWANRLLSSPENRAGIEKQFRDGHISATMFNWLKEQADRIEENEKKKSPMRTIVEACTDEELAVLMAVCRRAMGDEENTVYRGKTFAEIIAIADEVLRP